MSDCFFLLLSSMANSLEQLIIYGGKYPPPPAIRLPSVLECVNMDEARVQFVKNKNKSGGAREAGSGHERLGQIPVPDQDKQRAGQTAALSGASHRLKLEQHLPL